MSGAEKRLFDYILRLLLFSSIMELLLNRIFSRVGVFVPRDELFISIYTFLSQLGILALNFSSILLFFVLFKIAGEKLRLGGRWNLALATLIFFALLLSVAFIFVAPNAVLSIFYSSALLLALLLISHNFFLSVDNKIKKYALAAILAVYFCSYYYKLSNFAFQILGSAEAAPFAVEIFALGELLALAASVLVFLAYRGGNKKALALASILSTIFFAANLIESKMVAIIIIWSLGYTLLLPYPIYAAAFFLFSYAAFKLVFEKRREGYAFALIFIAGYQIPLSYNQLLLLLGFALLARKNL